MNNDKIKLTKNARVPMEVTAKKVLLPYIIKFQKQYGFSPSFREMRDALGKRSLQTVKWYLEILAEQRFIKIGKNLRRHITIIKTK